MHTTFHWIFLAGNILESPIMLLNQMDLANRGIVQIFGFGWQYSRNHMIVQKSQNMTKSEKSTNLGKIQKMTNYDKSWISVVFVPGSSRILEKSWSSLAGHLAADHLIIGASWESSCVNQSRSRSLLLGAGLVLAANLGISNQI